MKGASIFEHLGRYSSTLAGELSSLPVDDSRSRRTPTGESSGLPLDW